MQRFWPYILLTRLNRPIGIFLLLWPTLWALWLASNGQPEVKMVAIFIAGVVLMRSAGCVINDYADRHLDLYVQRTQNRPLTCGQIKPQNALILFMFLVFFAALLVWQLNTLTQILSLGALVLVMLYPFMKRFTHWPQLFLGMAFACAVPMAFSAQTGQIPWLAGLLFLITVLWTVAYDTMYAMTDRADDVKIGIKSTAILFGDKDKFIIALLQSCVLALLLYLGNLLNLNISYYLGLTGAAGFALYQMVLIWHRQPQACLQAFLNNNWFGFSVFVGIVCNYLCASA